MFKYLTLLLLLAANIHLAQSQELFLSPPYPPTGFYQQYYEVRFRVRGLSFPAYTFTNLPSFFAGSKDGVVSGTPNVTGTFRFTISYADSEGNNGGSEKVVISIADSPNTAASNAQSQAVVNLIIQAAADTWIYRSGDKISIQLNSQNGVSPITWNYKNLPAGLSGDNSGLISGTISKDGSYSFSASCGDAKGQNAQSFYTLNVQPGTLIKSNSSLIQPTTSSLSPTAAYPSSMTSTRLPANKLPLIRP